MGNGHKALETEVGVRVKDAKALKSGWCDMLQKLQRIFKNHSRTAVGAFFFFKHMYAEIAELVRFFQNSKKTPKKLNLKTWT